LEFTDNHNQNARKLIELGAVSLNLKNGKINPKINKIIKEDEFEVNTYKNDWIFKKRKDLSAELIVEKGIPFHDVLTELSNYLDNYTFAFYGNDMKDLRDISMKYLGKDIFSDINYFNIQIYATAFWNYFIDNMIKIESNKSKKMKMEKLIRRNNKTISLIYISELFNLIDNAVSERIGSLAYLEKKIHNLFPYIENNFDYSFQTLIINELEDMLINLNSLIFSPLYDPFADLDNFFSFVFSFNHYYFIDKGFFY